MDRPDILDGLNPAQHSAVTHSGGPLLVVAGAGSGKTRVLTRRIAWLIEQGVSPFEILAITFTNKAAGEMKHRVEQLIGPVAQKMWVSTFHSACVRILRRDGAAIGFGNNFTIYDQADAVRLTGYVIRDLGLDQKRFQPRAIHGIISAAKNEGIDAGQYADRATVTLEKKAGEVYAEYQRRLKQATAMDFDDLLLNTVQLFRQVPDVLDRYQSRFRQLLVDEYQDTNGVQNEMVVRLAQAPRQHHRGGRLRPVGLPLPGRRHPQHHRVRDRLPRHHGGAAGAELPLHPDHPRRRQLGHRQQLRPQAQEPVDRGRLGRPHHPLPRRRRARRGPVRGGGDGPPPRRGRLPLG